MYFYPPCIPPSAVLLDQESEDEVEMINLDIVLWTCKQSLFQTDIQTYSSYDDIYPLQCSQVQFRMMSGRASQIWS